MRDMMKIRKQYCKGGGGGVGEKRRSDECMTSHERLSTESRKCINQSVRVRDRL